MDRRVIRPLSGPVSKVGGLVALKGSLAPDGAIFKRAAASPALFESEGRAVVFKGLEDLAARIDDLALDVEPGDILVLQNAGPSAAGQPSSSWPAIYMSHRAAKWSGAEALGGLARCDPQREL